MGKMKDLLTTIQTCEACYGKGIVGWVNGEDYDFEYCDCNPYRLIIEDGEVVMSDLVDNPCVDCGDNEAIDGFRCFGCGIDYNYSEGVDLFTTQEAK